MVRGSCGGKLWKDCGGTKGVFADLLLLDGQDVILQALAGLLALGL